MHHSATRKPLFRGDYFHLHHGVEALQGDQRRALHRRLQRVCQSYEQQLADRGEYRKDRRGVHGAGRQRVFCQSRPECTDRQRRAQL